MKKLKGKITILINRDKTSIELIDERSDEKILDIEIDPINFQLALSRLTGVDCNVEFNEESVDHLGKKLVIKPFEFLMPEDSEDSKYEMQKETARRLAKELCPSGYIPDLTFGSRESFIYKDGKTYANTSIKTYTE